MLKKVLNLHETVTYERLKSVCTQYGALVHTKVRLADVLPIEGSGISSGEYGFALRSHFDFLVADAEHTPLFAVEFDGYFHRDDEQQKRDGIKSQLCKRFHLPLLRINSNYLLKKYRGMDLLVWLLEVWFMSQAFDQQQHAGNIPYDEVFDPFFIVAAGGKKSMFPFWLSREQNIEIQKLCEAGKCKDPAPSHIVGVDKRGLYRAIAYLRLDDHSGIWTETAMRNQLFPSPILLDALGEIVVWELYDTFRAIRRKKAAPRALGEVKELVLIFQESCDIIQAAYVGDKWST